MRAVMLVSGLVLMAFGVLMLTDNVRWLSRLLPAEWGVNF